MMVLLIAGSCIGFLTAPVVFMLLELAQLVVARDSAITHLLLAVALGDALWRFHPGGSVAIRRRLRA
jgi:hypothetical protein